MRAFIAIDPGVDCRAALASNIERLALRVPGKSIRWVAADNLHLTLRFLGEVDAGQLAPLTRAVGRAVHRIPPFRSEIRGIRLFPAGRKPRVIAAMLSDDQPVRRLAAQVAAGTLEAGFEPEARPFRAHVTLARLRGAPPDAELFEMDGPCPDLVAKHVVIYESRLGGRAPAYVERARLALGDSEDGLEPSR